MSTVVLTNGAPQPIGPYSQAVVSGGLVFCSGQVGLDPATGQLVQGGVAAQTKRVLENLSAVLAAAGTSPSHVLRCTVFLKSMADFPAMNEVYAQFFTKDYPSRSTVEVARLPKDALVEIDCVAKLGN
jgi:2-iminobutanoate/2-iminopropanoate deaminase